MYEAEAAIFKFFAYKMSILNYFWHICKCARQVHYRTFKKLTYNLFLNNTNQHMAIFLNGRANFIPKFCFEDDIGNLSMEILPRADRFGIYLILFDLQLQWNRGHSVTNGNYEIGIVHWICKYKVEFHQLILISSEL